MYLLRDVMMLSGCLYGIHQNFYGIVLRDEKRLVLIDCGLDAADLAVMEQVLHHFGLEDYRVSDVYITHCHFDHCGNAAYFAEKGAKIYAGAADAESIRKGDERTLTYCYDRAFPVCESVIDVREGDRFELAEGYTLIAHETPGHSAGSICYELRVTSGGRGFGVIAGTAPFGGACGTGSAGAEGDAEGYTVLFSGDFVQNGEGADGVNIGIKVDPTYDYAAYLESVHRMLPVKADYVLTGHYKPDLTNGRFLMNHAYRELLVNREKYQN